MTPARAPAGADPLDPCFLASACGKQNDRYGGEQWIGVVSSFFRTFDLAERRPARAQAVVLVA